MELSKEIVEWCKYEALGQVLTEWKQMDATPCGYDEVLESLDNDGDTWVTDPDITVWSAFENNYASFIAEQIRSLYDSYINCAEFALKAGK